MCPLPLHNSPGSARSVAALPVAVIKSLPLATGLGLSLTIVLLYSNNTLAQTVPIQEVAQLSTVQPVTEESATSQHLLFVSPVVGNDTNVDGSQRSPFRTITHALQVAQPNTVIMLSAGTYSTDTGEVFPLMLKPGVTVQGDPSTQGRGIVIRGGGAFLSPTSAGQNITVLAEDQVQLIGVTVTNPNPRGYGVWVESGSPVIADSTFTGNPHNSISTVGSSAPLVRNNRFNQANKVDLAGAGPTATTATTATTPIAFHPPATTHSSDSSASAPVTDTQTTQAQISSAQTNTSRTVVQPAAVPRLTTAITELPPSTISSLPPSRNVLQTATSASPAPRSTPAHEIRVSPPTHSQTAIVPIAQRRSVQPSIEISVPPPESTPSRESVSPTESVSPSESVSPTEPISPQDNALQPAVAPRVQPDSTPQITPIAAAFPRNSVRSVAASSPTSSVPTSSVPTSSVPASANAGNSVSPRSTTVTRTLANPSQSVAPAASTQPAAAIDIPVPPPNPAPQTTLAYAPRPSSTFNAPIDIPVPRPESPPESSSIAPAAVRSQDVPSPPQRQAGTPTTNLLPVPSGDVPVGNVGDLPRISVASTQMGGMYYASSIRSALRYRVVVDASSEGMQSLVQSLIPGAFLTSINGQQLMQVGAFSSRDNAEQTAQLLSQNGLVAVIQEID